MFANRYTAVVDACSLVGTLRRNLLLTLAEAEFFRIRWSGVILDETEKAIAAILHKKQMEDYQQRAKRAREYMETAFEEAMVSEFDRFIPVIHLPDAKDRHVVAAALKAQAATIVTENLKDFPDDELQRFNLETRSADQFIADTIALSPETAVAAIKKMRERLNRPHKSADDLLRDMDAEGLIETVNLLSTRIELL